MHDVIKRVIPVVRIEGDPVNTRPWIGLFTRDGTELREISYPGYRRQRYDGGPNFVFQMPRTVRNVRVHAIGLLDQEQGNNVRPRFILLDTLAPAGILCHYENAPQGSRFEYPVDGLLT